MQVITLIIYLTVSLLQSKGPQLSYDKIKNQTLASTPAVEAKLKKEDYITKALQFNIQYSYRGERLTERPETANLVFRCYSIRWRFLEEPSRTGALTFPGGRVDLPQKPVYISVIGEKYLEETLTYQIKFNDLDKLIRSPFVDIQLGAIEARINEKQMFRIKEVLAGLPAGNSK
jgi:hypothetical protein